MRAYSHQLVLGALCAGRVVTAEGTQRPLHGGSSKEFRSPFTEDYGKHVDQLLEEWHVPGVAIGVVDGDDIWTEGYGIATYPSTPVTSSTLFYCASTTKAFTAALLAIMIESGNYTVPALPGTARRIGWDTPVHDIIPEDFVLMDAWATAHITLEDALSHRTGLPRHDKASTHRVGPGPGPGGEGTNHTATVRDGTRFLRYLPLNEPPRTKWQYCNQMYVAATHAVQTLAGGRFLGDLLRERIWGPLGMGDTFFTREDALAAAPRGLHLADGYGWVRGGGAGGAGGTGEGGFLRAGHMDLDEIGGAGSVISNVDDYARWVRSLLHEEGPVPKAGHEAIKTPRMIIDPKGALASGKQEKPYDSPEMYALGWITSSYRGHKFWTHSGGMNAFGTEVFFFPDLDFSVITMANTASSSNFVGRIIVWGLVDDKLGIPKEARHNWASDFEGWEEKTDAKINRAIDRYYPERPSRRTPPSLPLKAYTGTYYHPAYLNFTLELADPASTTRSNIALTATRPDATWQTFNEFEHVTGEYWMVYFQLLTNPAGPMKEYAPVQFRIGADGKADALGVTWLATSEGEEDTVEGLVWFDRVE